MNSRELVEKYLDFFGKKNHKVLPSAPLVPENDSSVLFTTAGMHPLVPHLLGEKHPAGKRLVNNQLCLRTDDIDDVGDAVHHTFFEMLGNWSLGDYWKKESINYSYEFLTKELGLDPKKIWITCFEGNKDSPKDTESAEIWQDLGIPNERIIFLPKSDNWWGPAGETGPCGPDSEIFYDTTGEPHGNNCQPGDSCGRFVEIWNNVFMEYRKTKNGEYVPLKQKNVDTGMGVDRTTAVIQGVSDDYLISDLWAEIIFKIEELSGKKYQQNKKVFRVIADHIRASVFVAAEDVHPSNKERGYVLRRLIRRSIRYGKMLGINGLFLEGVVEAVISTYRKYYSYLSRKADLINEVVTQEEARFSKALERGLKEIGKLEKIDGKTAFNLYQSYGFPLELTEEVAEERGQKINRKVFREEFEKHKKLSRTASSGMFRGGLTDSSEEVTKLHTATHILHAVLRRVLGSYVSQKGSNISSERLRFDFSYPDKLTEDEISKIQKMMNDVIDKKLPVSYREESLEDAVKEGALHFFAEKYGKVVKVYTIGDSEGSWFSKEVCGGPHVKNTADIGRVKIKKQEKIGAGLLRLYVVLDK